MVWKLIKAEIVYNKMMISIILSSMLAMNLFSWCLYPSGISDSLEMFSIIIGLIIIINWLTMLKKEKRNIFMAGLPLSAREFAIFRAVFPVIWAIIVIGLYVTINRLLMPVHDKTYTIILYAPIWLIFHIGHSINDDLRNIFSSMDDYYLLIILTVAAVIFFYMTGAFAYFFNIIKPGAWQSDYFDYFIFMFWALIMLPVSILTYMKRKKICLNCHIS